MLAVQYILDEAADVGVLLGGEGNGERDSDLGQSGNAHEAKPWWWLNVETDVKGETCEA